MSHRLPVLHIRLNPVLGSRRLGACACRQQPAPLQLRHIRTSTQTKYKQSPYFESARTAHVNKTRSFPVSCIRKSHTMAEQSGTAQPKIVLHWLENSRAQRIVWLLEELGLQYEVKTYKRIDKYAPPELKAIHPLGKSPILTITTPSSDPSAPPTTHTLAESAFIVDYLTRTYKKLLPPASLELKYQHLLHFAEGSFMPPLTIGFVLNGIKTASVPFFIKPITSMIVSKVYESYLKPTYEGNFEFLENSLKGSRFFCGDEVTGVDIMYSFPIEAAGGRVEGFNREKYPLLFRWLEEVKARPAYKRAVDRTIEFEGTML